MTNTEIEARLAQIRERCIAKSASHAVTREDVSWLLSQLALVQDLAAQREIQLEKALDERDRLLVFNQELDRERAKAIEERDAALARATCDGSFERQGAESQLAAIAAVWNADPMVAYESPAQVIGWLEARVSSAEAALKRYGRHLDSCCDEDCSCTCGLNAVRRD